MTGLHPFPHVARGGLMRRTLLSAVLLASLGATAGAQPTGYYTHEAELVGADTAPFDRFGSAVAISGGAAVVGAPGNGSAYVFERSGSSWTQQQKLVTSDATAHSFGAAVALQGDTLVVGAPDTDVGGAAYVFLRSGGTWVEQQKLVGPVGAGG